MGLVPFKGDDDCELSLSLPSEDIVRRWLSASQEKSCPLHADHASTLMLDFQAPGL